MKQRMFPPCFGCTNVACEDGCTCACHGPLGKLDDGAKLELALRVLEPFACWAKVLLDHGELEFLKPIGDRPLPHQPTVGDVRRAQQIYCQMVVE